MLSARAYVHQYAAHGVSAADLQACFAGVAEVVEAYGAL